MVTHFTIRDGKKKNKKAQTGSNTTKIKHIDIHEIMFRILDLLRFTQKTAMTTKVTTTWAVLSSSGKWNIVQ